MKEYVVCFLFAPSGRSVVLIRKERPDWQKGKLNGVGGKIEEGESPYQAAVREFHEETGLRLEMGWRRFAVLKTEHDTLVHFFYQKHVKSFLAKTMTDEHVDMYSVKNVANHGALPNLSWLIPMALSFDRGEQCRWFDLKEQSI